MITNRASFFGTLFLAGLLQTSFSRQVTITGFNDGTLTFSNSAPIAQRTVYTIEWRSKLAETSGWSNSWDSLREFTRPGPVVESQVPVFYRVAAYFDNTTEDTNVMLTLYSNAMVDASVALPEEIDDRLTRVDPSNARLSWRTNAQGKFEVKVASFMSYSTATNFYSIGFHELAFGDQWVTVYPELRDFCGDYSGPNPVLRVKQLLGIPPTAGNDTVVEFWVDPEYLFRPTPDPEVNDNTAGLVGGPDSPLMTPGVREQPFWAAWFNNTYATRDYGMTNGIFNAYPWTRLGYTYDWASTTPHHFGLSEFVIPSGTLSKELSKSVPIEVVTMTSAVNYGRSAPLITRSGKSNAIEFVFNAK
jgi:hypothetical protein